MKRTSWFILGFALLASICCEVAFAQCPGGNCSTYSYGWGWWPWYGYSYTQPIQTKTCTGPACKKCEGPACAKMKPVDEAETVPATADDHPESVQVDEKDAQAGDSVTVPAVVEEGKGGDAAPSAPSANPSLQPLPTDEVKEEVPAPADPEVVEVPVCPFASRVIALINQHRARAGLPPLKADINLVNGCQNHSRWMLSYGFQHASNGGRECIAMGVNTPESLVNLWMNSSGHRAIIMGWGTWIGIGSAGTYHTLRIR